MFNDLFPAMCELRRSMFVMTFGELIGAIGAIDLNDDVQSDPRPKGTPSWWKYEEDWNVDGRRFIKR